jgi:cyanate permease
MENYSPWCEGIMGSGKVIMISFSFVIGYLLHLLLFATAPMVTVIMEEMSLSHAEFGFIFSVAMVSLILFRIPWGLIGDRMGYIFALRIALPVVAASAVLRVFASDFSSLLISQFFLGLGLAPIVPCLPLLAKEWSSGKGAGLSTGIYVSGFAAGNATALGLTPYLIEILKWRGVLLSYSVFAIVMCVLWWLLAKSRVKKPITSQHVKFSTILKQKHVWVLLLFMVGSMGSYDTLATWLPKILEVKGINQTFASFLPFGFLAAGPVIGFLSDKFQKRRAILVLLGVGASISIIGISYAPVAVLLLCVFLSGFTIVGVFTLTLSAPAEDERLSASVGGVVGFVSSLGNVGPLVMPVVFGVLIDMTGTVQPSLVFLAALAGITFIVGSRVRA